MVNNIIRILSHSVTAFNPIHITNELSTLQATNMLLENHGHYTNIILGYAKPGKYTILVYVWVVPLPIVALSSNAPTPPPPPPHTHTHLRGRVGDSRTEVRVITF